VISLSSLLQQHGLLEIDESYECDIMKDCLSSWNFFVTLVVAEESSTEVITGSISSSKKNITLKPTITVAYALEVA
jgi:hypothetical protein